MAGRAALGPSHADPPTVQCDKTHLFSHSLHGILMDAKVVKPSPNKCAKCHAKKCPCVCEQIEKLVGRSPAFKLPNLDNAKERLNSTKNKLDEKDFKIWKQHTSRTDDTTMIVPHLRKVLGDYDLGPELVTNGWAKMFELLNACPDLLPSFKGRQDEANVIRAVHLCECPGAFIAATNHFIKTNPQKFGANVHYDWKAMSLNPYYEANNKSSVLEEDVLFMLTFDHWLRGKDDSGDILNRENIKDVWKVARDRPAGTSKGPWLADLVTADGSIDVQHDANQQELLTFPLHFAELVTSLGFLNVGGALVLKMYTLFEHHSLAVLSLMAMTFRHVAVAKPSMSKAGNSEVYALGLGYLGVGSKLLKQLDGLVRPDMDAGRFAVLPEKWNLKEFREDFEECARYFAERQTEAIEANLESFVCGVNDKQIAERRKAKLRNFIRLAPVRPIALRHRLIADLELANKFLRGNVTNTLREGTRDRVTGLQTDREQLAKFYSSLQTRRKRMWKESMGRGENLKLAAAPSIEAAAGPAASGRASASFGSRSGLGTNE
eukprot:GHVT01042148.1.p1 GENE.GHVT01042148.1~~GHVT01042148.1.p1  ORF type:complete len:548 (-),score=139.80 GHVT01042148.1:610-2253(-)